MDDSSNDGPQLSLGSIITKLPEVRAARKININSRVNRRLIEPIAADDTELAYQHTVFCQTGLPYRNPGDSVREWHVTRALSRCWSRLARRAIQKTALGSNSVCRGELSPA